jgi:hypothetical protein
MERDSNLYSHLMNLNCMVNGIIFFIEKVVSSRGTLRNPFELDLYINHERQDCKIGTVWGGIIYKRERVNEGD